MCAGDAVWANRQQRIHPRFPVPFHCPASLCCCPCQRHSALEVNRSWLPVYRISFSAPYQQDFLHRAKSAGFPSARQVSRISFSTANQQDFLQRTKSAGFPSAHQISRISFSAPNQWDFLQRTKSVGFPSAHQISRISFSAPNRLVVG